jgi:carotenoid cleavage dioxygenase-like enzyme
MWAYHHINAFEKDNTIVIDVNGYETAEIVTSYNGFAYIPNVKDPNKRINQVRDGNWYRIKIPLKSNGTFIEYTTLPAIDANGKSYTAELLRTNDNLAQGVERRYSYGFTGFPGKDSTNDYGNDKTGSFTTWSIVKLDHHIAESLLYKKEKGSASIKSWSQNNCYPSESIFVSKNKDNFASDSDDGVVLSVVYDGTKKQSFLLVLAAQTMEELGRCYLTKRIPFSFHGTFLH